MSDLELCDQLMTLLLAGRETTATALAWSLERLPQVPAKGAQIVLRKRTGATPQLA